jgi:hypothetical protein
MRFGHDTRFSLRAQGSALGNLENVADCVGDRMPQYFFIFRTSDTETQIDPHGRVLPDLRAALSYAERTIGELQKEGRYQYPGPMMIVTDEARQVVLTLPFFPACA